MRAAPASPGTGHPTGAPPASHPAAFSIIDPTATGESSPPGALTRPPHPKLLWESTAWVPPLLPVHFPRAVTARAQLLHPPTRRPAPHRHRFPRAVQDPQQPSCPRCSPPTTCSTPRAASRPPDPATCWWPCFSPTSFILSTIPFPSSPRWPGPLLPSGRPWLLRTGLFPCWKAQGSCSGAGSELLPSHKLQEVAEPFLSWPRAQRRKELGLGASCPSGRKRGPGPSPGLGTGAVPGAGPLARSLAPSLSLHWAGNPKGAAEGGHGVQAQPAWGWALPPFAY